MFPNLGFRVSPLSWKAIEAQALNDRMIMGYRDEFYLPLSNIENLMQSIDPEFCLLVENQGVLGSKEGIAQPWNHCITLREDVAQGLEDGNYRARFTLAHELGHYRLHGKELIGFARNTTDTWSSYCDSEKQANEYAARLLMPKHLLEQCHSVNDVRDLFGVSNSATELNFRMLKEDNRK